jgi:hypothetical protein
MVPRGVVVVPRPWFMGPIMQTLPDTYCFI